MRVAWIVNLDWWDVWLGGRFSKDARVSCGVLANMKLRETNINFRHDGCRMERCSRVGPSCVLWPSDTGALQRAEWFPGRFSGALSQAVAGSLKPLSKCPPNKRSVPRVWFVFSSNSHCSLAHIPVSSEWNGPASEGPELRGEVHLYASIACLSSRFPTLLPNHLYFCHFHTLLMVLTHSSHTSRGGSCSCSARGSRTLPSQRSRRDPSIRAPLPTPPPPTPLGRRGLPQGKI